jgi:pilus assembly protein CpaF
MELRDRLANRRPTGDQEPRDAFAELKDRVHSTLIAELGPQLFDSDLEDNVLRDRVRSEIRTHLSQERGISLADRDRLVEEITDDTLGHGPLERLLADETVTEIMVNGPHDVWIERAGRLHESNVRFSDDAHLRRIINKIVGQIGRRIDESSPMVDARLPDGSRVNAIIPPLSLSGPLLTIRKFSKRRLDLEDLVRLGTLTPESSPTRASPRRCTSRSPARRRRTSSRRASRTPSRRSSARRCWPPSWRPRTSSRPTTRSSK